MIGCIEYLRNQRAGQAAFIPLDSIQVKPINDKFRSFANNAQLAADAVKYEPAAERAIYHACGNDKIETVGFERPSSIYRKCCVEKVRLPLLRGHFKNISMEENLGEDVAIDVDEDDSDGEDIHLKRFE
ncbi:hypothetical protein AX14_012146 [Amanita brunnescens Koide BX004]|nr:hypothetical protein AX14_012146 [Amanita brunnescens Koide BX004]